MRSLLKTSRITLRRSLLALLALSSLALVACQPKLTPEEDCNFVMSSEIQRVSWKANLPVKMYISPEVPIELRQAVRIAASKWNLEIGKEALLIYEDDNTPTKSIKDGINIISWETSWNVNRPSEQARTTITWRGDTINEADILVNAKNHQFSAFGEINPSKIDFTALMVHELGHVLGLQHVTGEPSVMNPTLALNTARIDIESVDADSLKCEYN